jgi:glycerophosphoryl diester phosphodiesterase
VTGSVPRSRLLVRLHELAARAPLVVGHRGDSGSWPENTLPAFAAAAAAGAAMIEFDVRQTRDRVFVCIHDETLDRTTDAARALGAAGLAVHDLTQAELVRCDAGSWKGPAHRDARIPTLEEALRAMRGRSIPMIEHKAGSAEDLVDLLRRCGMTEDVLVQSFAWDFVARVHALEPAIALGALGEGTLTPGHERRLPDSHAGLVHWDVDGIRAEDVERLRARGYLTCVYTANSDVALVGAAGLGIDAITTNHPGRLRDLIAGGWAVRRTS